MKTLLGKNTKNSQSEYRSVHSESSSEWQNLALDMLARLTKQFAMYPDCVKLIDLVLLSITGQLSATGAFACFITSFETSQTAIYRGSGLLYQQESLKALLEQEENRQFFINQSRPLRISDMNSFPSVPTRLYKLLDSGMVSAIVPIIVNDSLLGVLGLSRKTNRYEYDESELSLLGTLSDTISPLLSNSLLYVELDSLNRWHRDVMDSVRQGILVFDLNFHLKQANAQAQRVLNDIKGNEDVCYESNSVQISNLFCDKTFPGWLDFIKTAAFEDVQNFENLLARDKTSTRIFLVRVSRTSGNTSMGSDIVVTFDEITEQRRNEQRMFEMEQFAEKGVMAASIAHELNNHLTLILGGIELTEIASRRNDMEKIEQSLKKLKRNTMTMERFTAGLTDSTKMNSEKIEANLNKIVTDTVSFARVQKRFNGIYLATMLTKQLPRISADPDQLTQLLLNLLNNGADAIRDCKNDDGRIEVDTKLNATTVTLVVTDNGIGIPENLKDKLFNSQFTTKDYGHGFGMVTCGRILEYHKAKHSVESNPGKGTSISIEFPIS